MKKSNCLLAAATPFFLAVACGGAREHAVARPPSPRPVVEAVPDVDAGPLVAHAPVTARYDIPDEAMRAAIVAVVETTSRVVESPAFKAHLEHLTDLQAGPTAGIVPSEEVYRSYVGLSPESHPGPIAYLPKMADGKILPCHMSKAEHALQPTLRGAEQTASTRFRGAEGSSISLNQCTFDRAAMQATDVSAFACAINTIAHEWTHTVFDASGRQRYVDRGHDGEKLVSYTVGAVAQCTYLESIGSLPGTFDACVDDVGTSILKRAPCKPGWAKPPN